MCGIAGYVGPRNAVEVVFDQLKRLELLERLGTDIFYPTIGAAIDAYLVDFAVDWKP